MLLKTEITTAIHSAMGEVRDGHHDAADSIVRLLANRPPNPLRTIIAQTLVERLEIEPCIAAELSEEIVAQFNLIP